MPHAGEAEAGEEVELAKGVAQEERVQVFEEERVDGEQPALREMVVEERADLLGRVPACKHRPTERRPQPIPLHLKRLEHKVHSQPVLLTAMVEGTDLVGVVDCEGSQIGGVVG